MTNQTPSQIALLLADISLSEELTNYTRKISDPDYRAEVLAKYPDAHPVKSEQRNGRCTEVLCSIVSDAYLAARPNNYNSNVVGQGIVGRKKDAWRVESLAWTGAWRNLFTTGAHYAEGQAARDQLLGRTPRA